MKTLILTSALAGILALPAVAGDFTWSNDRGATAEGNRTCSRTDGSYSCKANGVTTDAQGRTRSWTKHRVADGSSVTVTRDTAGAYGSRSWTRSRAR